MCEDCESTGITIPTGETGATGATGGYGGFSSMWLWSTATGSAPGSTFMRFNSGTFSSVTTIYIDQTNGNSSDLSAFLASFGTEGLIRVFKASDPTKFWLGTLTNSVDSGAYYTLTVTYITSNGSFSASDEIVVSFTSKGNDGDNGTSILYNGLSTTSITNNTPSYTQADSYTVTGGTLATDGDMIKIQQNFTKNTSILRPAPTAYTKLTLTPSGGGTTTVYDYLVTAQYESGSVMTEISRISSTTALVKVWSFNIQGNTDIVENGKGFISRSFTIPWATDLLISAEYLSDSITITHQQLLVEFYNK